ncbi:hypothetical protein LR48_Vigan07g103200 [Vigna angularis]|uniref:Uncharacterized protein n=1 Tax=Phaseolus angularis TaxID=3914 RepID=A0A0L9UX37_PHAAN|nr:hypothetical protein LR48_Vigan07g103200 [Vigna angularis]
MTSVCRASFIRDVAEKRSKAQGISAQNKIPHLLSRGGYRKLEKKIIKQKSDSRLPLSEGGDPPPPPSPPSRHEKWKLAHIRPLGSYTSKSVREISERIDSLVEQSSQGQFTQEGHQDILATYIGRPEHPERVHPFTKFRKNYYLNIVHRNVVKVFPADVCPPTIELVKETPKPVIRLPMWAEKKLNVDDILCKFVPPSDQPSTSKEPNKE